MATAHRSTQPFSEHGRQWLAVGVALIVAAAVWLATVQDPPPVPAPQPAPPAPTVIVTPPSAPPSHPGVVSGNGDGRFMIQFDGLRDGVTAE